MNTQPTYCVIMAGGVGNRFWPLSNKQRPKQFLDLFGVGRSLLQLTVDRFRSVVPLENMIIVTNVLYRDIVTEQLPEMKSDQILCEPARRNTAPCIAYAVAHIKGVIFQRVMQCPMIEGESVDWNDDKWNANILVVPSDHLILREDNFIQVINEGLDFVTANDTLLTLGIAPTRPETGYGYIQMVLSENKIKRVKTFTEKPNQELANIFYQSGEFVWNSGIYMWNMRTIGNEMNKYLPDMMAKFQKGEACMATDREEEFIQEIFPTCPNISIDYGVMEKSKNVHVIISDFGWSDLGTWQSVYDVSQKDACGNAVMNGNIKLVESSGNLVSVADGQVAMVRGLKDFIVTLANNVLVICPRSDEEFVDKEISSIKNKD